MGGCKRERLHPPDHISMVLIRVHGRQALLEPPPLPLPNIGEGKDRNLGSMTGNAYHGPQISIKSGDRRLGKDRKFGSATGKMPVADPNLRLILPHLSPIWGRDGGRGDE